MGLFAYTGRIFLLPSTEFGMVYYVETIERESGRVWSWRLSQKFRTKKKAKEFLATKLTICEKGCENV